jgi:TatD DNase family protein
MLADTHCHLDFPEFDSDRDEVIKRAKDNNVDFIINIGSSVEGSIRSVELSKKYPNVYSVVGIHPHEADTFTKEAKDSIRELAKDKKVVAIGEIGLDYFKNFSRSENQRLLFTSLLELAKDLNKPLVIHTRQAQTDTLKILKEAMPLKAVVHCFSGDKSFLDECLGMGFLISFTCNITYKKAENLRELVKLTQLNRLMLETDAPFLSPEGYRGVRNEPMQIRLLAEFIARLKGLTLEEVASQTTKNAVDFFAL